MKIGFIYNKKIPPAVCVLLLYLSLCCANYYIYRGYLSLAMQIDVGGLMNNKLAAFFLAGLIPLAAFEFLTRIAFRSVRMRVGCADDLKYTLRFFYFLASVVSALIKICYFFNPIYSVYGEIFIDFVITTAFFVLYYWYICKVYLDNSTYAPVFGALAPLYFGVYAMLSLLNLGGVLI